jgi:cysteine desulfurase / selenocysteine lyase
METKLITDQEVQQYRAETKGTKQRVHFNNAGSSLPPDVVVDIVVNYLREEAIYGGYETEAKYSEELNNTYNLIAQLINADKDEIALAENASFAWGSAFNGINFKPGDEVIISEMEYVTNMIGFLNAEKIHGIKIKIVYNDDQGNFDLEALENTISAQTKLIAVTHIASSTGGVIPVVEIGKIAAKYQVLYLVDACQSVGQVPVDVKEINCDMLAVTGRKYLRAPRGTGFLYVRKQMQDKLKVSFIDGFTTLSVSQQGFKLRDDARRFELYEKNRALTLGLGKAVEYALNVGVDRIWHRIQHLSALMRRQLNNIDGIIIHDIGDQQCGIVTFSVDGFEASSIKIKLAEKQINVSVGLAKSTLIYMDKHHLASVVRASVHYYNTEEEILLLCNELVLLLKNEA